MKAFITKVSNYAHEETKDFNTLTDLLNYIKENGRIIVDEVGPWYRKQYGADFEITLYDDYIEG